MFNYWVNKAIGYCRSQKKLAKRMGVHPERVSYLLNTARKISIEDALLIEKATDNHVTRYHLLGKLKPSVRRQLDKNSSSIHVLPISERVKQGIAYEETLKNQKINKNSGKNDRDGIPPCQNFDTKKYRSDALAAKCVAFGNHQSYREAKKVIQLGCANLIKAMISSKFFSGINL